MSGLRVLEFIDEKEAENPKRFWMKTYLLVFVAPLFLAAGLYFLLEFLGFSTTLDDDTTRYLLSAFIQSLAAVIAIVVSLTLVAIQFTASEYSSRVIEVFKKNPAMWAIIAGYISGISLFAFILMGISDSEAVSGIKSYAVFYSFFLFIALLVTLIPHIRITLNSMNAEKVIDVLINDLTIEKILSLNSNNDPFQDIFVIINYSALNGDMITYKNGLKKITNLFAQIIDFPEIEDKLELICDYYYNDVQRTSFILFDKKDDRYIYDMVAILDDLTSNINDVSLIYVTKSIHRLKYGLVNKSIEYNFKPTYAIGIYSLSKAIKKTSFRYSETKNKDYLSILENLMLLMEEIAHSFMETSNKKSFNEIIFDFSKIELEFEDKKMKLPSKVIERLVSHWKNIVYIYMSSPECQNYNYYEKPIAEIQKVLLIHELRDSTINKYLSILTKIGKDAYLKYNLPEVTVFIKNTLFEIGAFYESNGILDSQLCPAHNIVDLYLSCPGLEQKEEELNKKIYHTYEDPKRKEEKANALLKSIYYDFKAANIHAEDLYPGE